MKIFCTASSDAYITDKIIDEKLRAEDANVGRAGTLDLFKLYDENKLNGVSSQNEISRLLVKFDLSKARDLMTSKLDINNGNFSAKIKLFDVRSGHATPSDFNVIAHPLSRSFTEGVGRDISKFEDLSVVNFLTSSIVNGRPQAWYASGANYEGLLGSDDIDIIGSGSLTSDPNDVQYLYGTQHFITGDEDLEIDVTPAISGTLAGKIEDHGFRISFSGSDETDLKSRFVKRFASRHSSNPLLQPRLEISFPDYVVDDRENFYFDTNSTIFLTNSRKSTLSNFISGGSEVSGENSLKLKLVKGGFTKIIDVSSHKEGTDKTNKKGVYSASFTVSSEDTTEYIRGDTIAKLVAREKEITFDEYWYSSDGSKGFYTGSLTIKSDDVNSTSVNDNIDVFSVNCKTNYDKKDQERIHVFGINHTEDSEKARKKPIKKKSVVFDKIYYRVLDANSLDIIFDFGEKDESTRLSTDPDGMYFDFHFDILPYGRSYMFEFLVVHKNIRKIVRDKRSRFTVQ